MQQFYCTVAELLEDLDMDGIHNRSEARIVNKIASASKWIKNNIGTFIPETAEKTFDGDGSRDLILPHPLLAVTSIVHDEDTLLTTDYIQYPLNRLWENGPYMRLAIGPDATTLYSWLLESEIVTITGRWGMFEDTKSSGATVASQDDSSTSLVVDDASGISPGAVLLIESEQQLVTACGAATDSTANTAEALDNEEEVITLNDATLLHTGEVIRVEFEQMLVLDISGNDILVQRGWNRTSRVAHDTGKDVYVYRTFTVTRGANGTTAAAHTSQTISRYVVPEDINYLCREIAALMLRKADSGFSGKVGSVETGETFYFNEFPNSVIDKIKNFYFFPVI